MSLLYDFLAPIAKTGLTWLGRRRLPQIDGELTLPGLTAPVEIIRDRWGIPHIYAENTPDLFFGQGFVHAQDRLWQMELNRRTGQGSLSELFGSLALDTDRAIRTFGFNRLGRADWANASPDIRAVILAYTAGVNAYLTQPAAKMPVEFTLLNYRPFLWQPEDVTGFSRVMMWQLSHAWHSELIRAQLIEAVGPEAAAELEIYYPETNPITLPAGIEFNRLDPDGRLSRAAGPFLQRGLGSNSWVIASSKSATGQPLLCNDVHLAMSLPSLWYEAHLVAGDFNVTGITAPGLPMVLVGHNARLAWGITLAFTDCEDLFIEQFNPESVEATGRSPLQPRYLFRGEWQAAEVIIEEIPVKGQAEPHREQVIITRHGPIISDIVDSTGQRVAVNSMALRPSPTLNGWLLLNQASGWDDFVAAMRQIEAPQINVAYADVDGNIGHWVTGKTPVRAKGDGTVPVPGWTGEYEWVDEIPFEEMPHLLNPEKGYIISSNHRLMPDDYPYYLGNAWMNGYRARRIEQILAAKDKISLDDCRPIHLDFTCLPGLELVARLADLSPAPEAADAQLALKCLRAWDGRLSPDSVGGAVYEVTRYRLVRNLLAAGLDDTLALRWLGQSFNSVLLGAHEFYGHDTVAMLRMLDKPDSWWVRQAGGRTAVLTQSLQEATAWLRAELGPEVEGWQWGKIHRSGFAHALSLQKPLDRVFNRGPFPIGGDTDTPCQTAFHRGDPYDNKAWAPTYRQVIDVGDWSRAQAIFPPGQSGQLGSPHYDDLIDPWLKGEYHPMLWTRAEVEQAAEGRLILKKD